MCLVDSYLFFFFLLICFPAETGSSSVIRSTVDVNTEDSGMSSSDDVVGMVTSSASCETVASSSSPHDVTTVGNPNEMGSEGQDVSFKRKEGSLSTAGGPD